MKELPLSVNELNPDAKDIAYIERQFDGDDYCISIDFKNNYHLEIWSAPLRGGGYNRICSKDFQSFLELHNYLSKTWEDIIYEGVQPKGD